MTMNFYPDPEIVAHIAHCEIDMAQCPRCERALMMAPRAHANATLAAVWSYNGERADDLLSAIEDGCRQCAPFPCDDPDRHLGVPSEYTPLANRGCHCGADYDGRDCMCFESYD